MDFCDLLECFDEGSFSLLICVAGILGAFLVHWSARHLGRTVAKHAGRISHCGLSGRHVAQRLLAACGLTDIKVTRGAKIDVYRETREERVGWHEYERTSPIDEYFERERGASRKKGDAGNQPSNVMTIIRDGRLVEIER